MINFKLVTILVLISALLPAAVFACSGGTNSFKTSIYKNIGTSVARRNKIGVEYAFDNAVVRGITYTIAAKVIATSVGVPPKAIEITSAINSAINQAMYTRKHGFDFQGVHTTVAAAVEVAIPDPLMTLDFVKLAAAYTAAYSWGFLYGT